MEMLESVLFVCRECQVFRARVLRSEKPHIHMPNCSTKQIPPRTSNQGMKAADWNESLIWTGRCRIVASKPFGGEDSKDETAEIKFEDSSTGDLFAAAPYDSTQVVEPVLDSSRYFVVRVVDRSSGQKAYLGMGFQERSDAFDFNVALQEYNRRKNAASEPESSSSPSPFTPSQDFSLKEGQTFSINLGSGSGSGKSRAKPSNGASAGGAVPLLPPPPSASQVKRGA